MKLKVAQSSHTKVLSALQSLLVYTDYYHCTLNRKKNKAVTTWGIAKLKNWNYEG